MTKPVTGLVAFDGSDQGSVADIDGNNDIFENAINDLNTYGNFLTDTGAANAYVVTLAANLTGALSNGLVIQMKAANSNTGASTLNYNATGTKDIQNMDGTSLASYQIMAGSIVQLQYSLSATAWQLMTPCVIREGMAPVFTFDGSGAATGVVTVRLQKAFGWVTMQVPAMSATTGTGSASFTSNANVPVAYRPPATQEGLCVPIRNNGASVTVPGRISVSAAGVIDIIRDNTATAFTNTASGGVSGNFSWSYWTG